MHPNLIARPLHMLASVNVSLTPCTVYSLTVQWSALGQGRVSLEDIGNPAGSGTERFWARQAAVLAAGDLTSHYVFPGGLVMPNGCFFERNQTDIVASITFRPSI